MVDAAAAIAFPGEEGKFLRETCVLPVYILAVIPVAINWHRRILLGPGFAARGALDLSIDRRAWLFLWNETKISIIGVMLYFGISKILLEIYLSSGFFDFVFSLLKENLIYEINTADDAIIFLLILITGGIAMVICFLIIFRLFLAFPATAVDQNRSLRAAWRLGRGNTFRLTTLFFFANLPFYLMEKTLDFVENRFTSQVGMEDIWVFLAGISLISVIGALFFFVRTSVAVAALTSGYYFLNASENPEFRNQLRGKEPNQQILASSPTP